MRAIRVHQFGGPEVLKLETDVPVPKPAAGQVLVKIHAAGVNPVETYIRSGTFSPKPDLPYTPGGDCAGTVEDVGEGVTKFKKGDRVFTFGASGTYAEYAAADEAHTFKLPSNVGYNEGAALGVPYFTAVRSIVHKAHAKPGEVMLVHGASGGVGLACCQIGRAMGLRVLGTAGTKEGLDLVLQNGAHEVFNHRDPDYLEKIQKSAGQGPDIIMEMLANVNLQKDLDIARPRARIVIIGSRGPIEVLPFVSMMKELEVIGVILFSATKDEFAEMGAYLAAGMEQGTLRPVVGRQFKLGQASDAHREIIEHSQGSNGKIVLAVQE